jgi:hypothetical protein
MRLGCRRIPCTRTDTCGRGHPTSNHPEYIIRTSTLNRIPAKINGRSCYETRANALHVLTKFGHRIVTSRLRSHYTDLGSLKLENLVTNTMFEICQLKPRTNFMDDEAFVEEIEGLYALSIKNEVLPGPQNVVEELYTCSFLLLHGSSLQPGESQPSFTEFGSLHEM